MHWRLNSYSECCDYPFFVWNKWEFTRNAVQTNWKTFARTASIRFTRLCQDARRTVNKTGTQCFRDPSVCLEKLSFVDDFQQNMLKTQLHTSSEKIQHQSPVTIKMLFMNYFRRPGHLHNWLKMDVSNNCNWSAHVCTKHMKRNHSFLSTKESPVR